MKADVAIVGGGPVGMGLAIELGQRGVKTVVVERHLAPPRIPKGQNLTQRTMEHMRAWGTEAAVRAARTIPEGWGIGGLTAYGTLNSGFAYDWWMRTTVDPYYAARGERLPQYATEAVLRARAAELASVSVLAGHTATALAQDGEGVTVTAQGDGETVTVRAAYAVGCDGSRSLVREAAGITETCRDHAKLMALVVFRSEDFFALLQRFPDKQFYNVLKPELDGYWAFFGMVDWGRTCFFHAPVPAGTTRQTLDVASLLAEAVGERFDFELEHLGFWDLRIALADSYRSGRLFIAGDAAHTHPPYGGYGINIGFEDARNLGWKLAAMLQGWGGKGLADSYEAERRPVFESTARDFIEAMIERDREFVRNFDPARDRAAFDAAWQARAEAGSKGGVTTFAPHYRGSPIVHAPGTPGAVGEHAFAARAGHHLAPQPLCEGRSTLEALGEGFTLLALGVEPPPFQAAAEALAIPLRVVRGDPELTRYGVPLVLVRPDQFVAWTGPTGADPRAVLAKAAGRAAA